VRVVDLSHAYERDGETGLLALDRVSLSVGPGEFCAIVGPSGCGKSTLLMAVAGLYAPSAGNVFVNHTPVLAPYTDLGIVFQRDVLLEWRTVLDNVLLPVEIMRFSKAAYRPRAEELLDLVGLREFATAYPAELSGGMRQRAAICRALVLDPPLLLMDEPFGALDALTREKLNMDLLRLTRDSRKTVVFITHDIDEAVLLADHVVVMGPRPGRVVRVLEIDLPRPRSLSTRIDMRFGQLVADIRQIFHSMGVI
jgi:NitT/TauT family transport system ATP-binding protein